MKYVTIPLCGLGAGCAIVATRIAVGGELKFALVALCVASLFGMLALTIHLIHDHMTQLTRRVSRSTSDKKYVISLEPGDKVSVRLYRHREEFRWGIDDLFRVMAKAKADAELSLKQAKRRYARRARE